MEQEQTELVGTVDELIYSNEENGYTVLSLETDAGETVTVTGCLPFASPGEQLIVHGTWVRHPTHGRQFQANTAERRLPSGAVTGKLIDFDNCFWEVQPPRPDEESHGDLVYMAPETFMMMQTEEGTIDRAIDVFALGVVFHQIFAGCLPGFDARYDYPFEAVLDGRRLAVAEAVPAQWRDLIARMLEGNRDRRVSLAEAEATLKRGEAAASSPVSGSSFFEIPGDL